MSLKQTLEIRDVRDHSNSTAGRNLDLHMADLGSGQGPTESRIYQELTLSREPERSPEYYEWPEKINSKFYL